MWRCVDLVSNDISEECIASVSRVEKSPSEREQAAADTEAIHSSETSVYTRHTRRHIPEDGIFHSHRCGNLKSYSIKTDLI
jgi:hypothetical protein